MFICLTRNKHWQVSDGPNGKLRGTVCLVGRSESDFIPLEIKGIRGSHFFMGTPAKCLPVGFFTQATFSSFLAYRT